MPLKKHGEHKLPYVSNGAWTLCGRNFHDRKLIAGSEEGVTCKVCLRSIEVTHECEAILAEIFRKGGKR